MITVADVAASLGGGLLSLAVDVAGAEVDDLTLAEPQQGLVGQPGDLVLGVGVDRVEGAVDLLRRAADAGAGGLVLRRALARRRTVRDLARRRQVALVELADHASWAHTVWLLRGVLDRAATAGAPGRVEAPVHDDLFALADAVAAVVDAPVTIEDPHSRVLAYSSRQDVTDPARVSTIVGRRVPEEVLASLRARGVFRRLARSAEPVFVPADPSGTLPRLVVPVRAGGEWLGSIWALVEERPEPQVVREVSQTASVVALHLLRLRAHADVGRRLAADRVRLALSGTAAGAEEWLPDGPWRVACLGGPPGASPENLLDLWESVCRRHSWHQPLLAALDGRVYAVLRAEGAVPGTWEWLRAVVEEAATEDVALTAAAGHPAYTASELGRARAEAVEAERSRGPRSAVGIEEVWAAVTVERAAGALREAPVPGPVEALRRHDAERGTDYVSTLTAWLDHPGEPVVAARTLHVHPNTLRYRMGRLAALPELQDVDLGDPLTRLALRLQLTARPSAPYQPAQSRER